MRLYLLFALLVSSCISHAQIEFFGGGNRSVFYDSNGRGGNYSTRYAHDWGYVLGISITEIRLHEFDFRLCLSYDQSKGTLHIHNGGLGGSSATDAKVTKQSLGIAIYPMSLNLTKRFLINLGLEMKLLLAAQTYGNQSAWFIYPPYSTNTSLADGKIDIHKTMGFGLSGRLAYSFKITEEINVIPQYICFLGFTPEFKNIGIKTTSSWRQYFGVGILSTL